MDVVSAGSSQPDDPAPRGSAGESGCRNGDRFQILALDGGGAKALFTAHVLARLEEDLGVQIADSFDLIAGTSAGGIVALGLGAGLRPAEIVDHYEEVVSKVFPKSRRWSPRRLVRPGYDAQALREALTSVLGARRLGDSSKRLVVPTWDVQRGTVHIFKTPHHPRLVRDWRTPMVDVALATSAAPTYFPAARVDGLRLVDGGVWANNPSVVAIAEAVSMLDVRLDAIAVLNVGTIDQLTNHPKRLDRGGFVQWAKPAAPLVLSATSRGAQGIGTHLIGEAGYTRFDAVVAGGLYALDSVNKEDVAGLGASVSRDLSPAYTERFAGHRATAYTPMHGSAHHHGASDGSNMEDTNATR